MSLISAGSISLDSTFNNDYDQVLEMKYGSDLGSG